MKKKITLQKATVVAGVVVMSVGLFNSFTMEANAGSGGPNFKCCKRTFYDCYHPDGHQTYADSDYYYGSGECPPDDYSPIWT